MTIFGGLVGEERGSGDRGQQRGNGRFGKFGIGIRVAVAALRFDGVDQINILDADRVVLTAEGAAGIVEARFDRACSPSCGFLCNSTAVLLGPLPFARLR